MGYLSERLLQSLPLPLFEHAVVHTIPTYRALESILLFARAYCLLLHIAITLSVQHGSCR